MPSMMRVLAAAVCVAATAYAGASGAQEWPTKPIRLIVPFPAGGGTDTVARTVANGIAEGLGQPIVIDNRGGAGGMLGSDVVAKAAAARTRPRSSCRKRCRTIRRRASRPSR